MYTKEQDEYIRQQYRIKTAKEIGSAIGRTPESIIYRARVLGLNRKTGQCSNEVKQESEKWADITGYEGIYQVSDGGHVRRVEHLSPDGKHLHGIILSPDCSRDGYLKVRLFKDGKYTRKQIHRLVATAFIPNPFNLPQINHKDENPSNNCVENLEWCTAKYNMNYGIHADRQYLRAICGENSPHSKLKNQDVLYIRQNYIPHDKSYGYAGLARKFSVNRMTVKSVVLGKTWKHLLKEESHDTGRA